MLHRNQLFSARGALVVLGLSLLGAGCGARRDGSLDPAQGDHLQMGTASWYGDPFTGRPTATGEIYDPSGMTAASKTLPLGSVVMVTNLLNHRTAVVRINDRGPYVGERILDCSEGVAHKLGFHGRGLTPVAIDWPPAGTVVPDEGRYWLQIGAFRNPASARKLRDHASAVVRSVVLHREDALIRVHAGPFRRRRNAEASLAELRQAGIAGIVVRLDPEPADPSGKRPPALDAEEEE
jgi:rare lipoprotein A